MIALYLRKAVIELEMAKSGCLTASDRQQIQDVIDTVLKLKWFPKR